MICPRCEGRKGGAAFGCGPAGCRPIFLRCSTCAGTGEISDERARWLAEGERLRTHRLTGGYLSLREAAERYGVGLGTWCDAENGRVDPAPLIARVLS